MKQLAFFFVLIPVLGIVNAQQSHITSIGQLQQANGDSDTIWPKQITGTDMYFEYLIQGKDTILRFTGKGHLSSRKAGEWYKYKATITCVEVCEGIKTVDGLASCPKLKKVTLPNGLKKINKEAFRYDSNLRQINFPEGLDSIFGYAFYQAGSPEDSLRFPASLSYIAGNCFLYNKYTEKTLIRNPIFIKEHNDVQSAASCKEHGSPPDRVREDQAGDRERHHQAR